METFVWLVETNSHLDWCNSAMTRNGGTYVMIDGQLELLVWRAGLLDIYLKASTHVKNMILDLSTISHADAIATHKSLFEPISPVKFWLDDVRCNGNESSLLNCLHAGSGFQNCNETEAAGVVCKEGVYMKLSIVDNVYSCWAPLQKCCQPSHYTLFHPIESILCTRVFKYAVIAIVSDHLLASRVSPPSHNNGLIFIM